MKKILKKRMKSTAYAVRYFSGELIQYWKPENFADGSTGTCHYSCK